MASERNAGDAAKATPAAHKSVTGGVKRKREEEKEVIVISDDDDDEHALARSNAVPELTWSSSPLPPPPPPPAPIVVPDSKSGLGLGSGASVVVVSNATLRKPILAWYCRQRHELTLSDLSSPSSDLKNSMQSFVRRELCVANETLDIDPKFWKWLLKIHKAIAAGASLAIAIAACVKSQVRTKRPFPCPNRCGVAFTKAESRDLHLQMPGDCRKNRRQRLSPPVSSAIC